MRSARSSRDLTQRRRPPIVISDVRRVRARARVRVRGTPPGLCVRASIVAFFVSVRAPFRFV